MLSNTRRVPADDLCTHHSHSASVSTHFTTNFILRLNLISMVAQKVRPPELGHANKCDWFLWESVTD